MNNCKAASGGSRIPGASRSMISQPAAETQSRSLNSVQSPDMNLKGLKLYRTEEGVLVERGDALFRIEAKPDGALWDAFITRDDLQSHVSKLIAGANPLAEKSVREFHLKAPIGSQEVW